MQDSKYARGKKFAATHSVQRNWCIFVNEFEFIACFAALRRNGKASIKFSVAGLSVQQSK